MLIDIYDDEEADMPRFRFGYLRVTLPVCIIYTFVVQKLHSDCASFRLCSNCIPYAYRSGEPLVI